MRTVRDESGDTYILEKRSDGSCRLRDPETGERCHRPADELEPVDEPPLTAAAAAVPEAVRTLVRGVHDERSLGLLVELDAAGPRAVRDLLADTTLCESDLHGTLGELRAAGLVAETTVAGERGYRVTETGSDALAALR